MFFLRLTQGTRLLILSALLLSISAGSHAAQEDRGPLYTKQVEVMSLDYARRTAIMSGYRYFFGNATDPDQPEVTMLNSNSGAFELLQPGMRVRVSYRRAPAVRVVESVQQMENTADLGLVSTGE